MGRECKGSGPLVSLSGGQGQRESIPQPQCALSLEVFFLKELLHRVSCFSVTYMPGYLRPEAAYSSPQKKQHLQRKRGQRPRHSSQWSSSGSSSSSREDYGSSSGSDGSSGSENSDVELEASLEKSRALTPQQYRVPDIDLWVPTRLITSQSQREGTGCYPQHPAVSCCTQDASQNHHKEGSTTVSAAEKNQLQVPYETHSTVPRGDRFLHFSDTHSASLKDPACKVGPRM